MNIAHLCLLVAGLLPFACAGVAKWGAFGRPVAQGGYDNNDPRAWLQQQEGFRRRANNAQANSFEALPLFIAAVLVAERAPGGASAWVVPLAVAFVALRVVYIGLYLADLAALRTVVWIAALGVNIALFFV